MGVMPSCLLPEVEDQDGLVGCGWIRGEGVAGLHAHAPNSHTHVSQVPIPLTEPFRVVLSHMRDRLYTTREVLHQCLVHQSANVRASLQVRGCWLGSGSKCILMHTIGSSDGKGG